MLKSQPLLNREPSAVSDQIIHTAMTLYPALASLMLLKISQQGITSTPVPFGETMPVKQGGTTFICSQVY